MKSDRYWQNHNPWIAPYSYRRWQRPQGYHRTARNIAGGCHCGFPTPAHPRKPWWRWYPRKGNSRTEEHRFHLLPHRRLPLQVVVVVVVVAVGGDDTAGGGVHKPYTFIHIYTYMNNILNFSPAEREREKEITEETIGRDGAHVTLTSTQYTLSSIVYLIIYPK